MTQTRSSKEVLRYEKNFSELLGIMMLHQTDECIYSYYEYESKRLSKIIFYRKSPIT